MFFICWFLDRRPWDVIWTGSPNSQLLVDGSCGLNRLKVIGALEKSGSNISSGNIHNRDVLHTLWEQLIAAGSSYLLCSMILESKMLWSLVSHVTKKNQNVDILGWIGECLRTCDETKCLLWYLVLKQGRAVVQERWAFTSAKLSWNTLLIAFEVVWVV